jgi:hypothetical protein
LSEVDANADTEHKLPNHDDPWSGRNRTEKRAERDDGHVSKEYGLAPKTVRGHAAKRGACYRTKHQRRTDETDEKRRHSKVALDQG